MKETVDKIVETILKGKKESFKHGKDYFVTIDEKKSISLESYIAENVHIEEFVEEKSNSVGFGYFAQGATLFTPNFTPIIPGKILESFEKEVNNKNYKLNDYPIEDKTKQKIIDEFNNYIFSDEKKFSTCYFRTLGNLYALQKELDVENDTKKTKEEKVKMCYNLVKDIALLIRNADDILKEPYKDSTFEETINKRKEMFVEQIKKYERNHIFDHVLYVCASPIGAAITGLGEAKRNKNEVKRVIEKNHDYYDL